MCKVSLSHPLISIWGLKILFSIFGWLNLWMQNLGIQMVDTIFIEKKNLWISKPMQFKPMLFKSQRYFLKNAHLVLKIYLMYAYLSQELNYQLQWSVGTVFLVRSSKFFPEYILFCIQTDLISASFGFSSRHD